MKKADLDKVIGSIKVVDLKDKVLMLDESTFSVDDAQALGQALQGVGLAAIVMLPPGAKYDIQTKEQLKKMVDAL